MFVSNALMLFLGIRKHKVLKIKMLFLSFFISYLKKTPQNIDNTKKAHCAKKMKLVEWMSSTTVFAEFRSFYFHSRHRHLGILYDAICDDLDFNCGQ